MDITTYLEIELKKRQEANSSYSLRAYARDLGVQAPLLSYVIRRKRKATASFINKVGKALKLSQDQIDLFVGHRDNYKKFEHIDMDKFLLMSDWHYDAIRELLRTKGFKSTVEEVSKRLGISIEMADAAVKKLFNHGVFTLGPNKKWQDNLGDTLFYIEGETSLANQKLQKQYLELATGALETIPLAKREQSSMVMAINKKDIPEIKKRIREFHAELMEYAQREHRTLDEVYQLVTTCFPLTKD